MATTAASKTIKLSIEVDDLEEAEKFRRALVLAKQNIDSEYVETLLDGINQVIPKLKNGE